MNFRDALARGAEKLRAAGIEPARLDARVLLAHVLGVETNEVILHAETRRRGEDNGRAKRAETFPDYRSQAGGEKELRDSATPRDEQFLKEFESLIARRAAREPVAYITGKKEFWSRDFAVGPGVLVPRPETETLIEEILKEFPDKNTPLKILDLGTGSGCILVTLLHLYPNAHGLGVDKSPDALHWAKRNAAGLESRCELRLADWEAVSETGFDIVVSNPPYLTSHELEHLQPEVAREPREALAGGDDGLCAYRALAALLPRFLAPSGCAVLEIGAGQGEGVSAILAHSGLEIARLAPDLQGIPRCIVARRAA